MTPPALGTAGRLLHVEELSLEVTSARGTARLLDRVQLTIGAGETLALIGESGSGKSLTGLSIAGLLPEQIKLVTGRIDWADEAEGSTHHVATVFQNPRSALNPVRRIGKQLDDVLAAAGVRRRDRREHAVRLLSEVAIDDPVARLNAFPFELSGGTCQRVLLALALARRPSLLIADEPTTGLDTLTQTRALDLIERLTREHGMSLLLITHDLAIALQRCTRIAVMHAGQIVEILSSRDFVTQTRHPYSQQLLRSVPQLARGLADLQGVPGRVPELTDPLLPACRFYGRCDRRQDRCATERPVAVTEDLTSATVWCWNPLPRIGPVDHIDVTAHGDTRLPL